MSPFKAFFLGFSLVMGFMTVTNSAQADQACVQKCLTQNLASPATKRKISTGVLTRSQLVIILTRKCVEECAQAAPVVTEPTAIYQPPIIAAPEPEAVQPEVGGTDGGEANDTAGTTDKPAEVVPAPPEPETMPTIVAPPSLEGKTAEIVAGLQTVLDRKAEKKELEDLRLKIAMLEKQIQGQTKVDNSGDGTETSDEAEVPENTDSAEAAGTTDKPAAVQSIAKDLPASSEDGQPKVLIILSVIVALATITFLLIMFFKMRRKNRLEVARRAAAADENELPPPPPTPARRGVVTGPPKISPDRIGTGTQVDFKHPSEVDP